MWKAGPALAAATAGQLAGFSMSQKYSMQNRSSKTRSKSLLYACVVFSRIVVLEATTKTNLSVSLHGQTIFSQQRRVAVRGSPLLFKYCDLSAHPSASASSLSPSRATLHDRTTANERAFQDGAGEIQAAWAPC